MAPTEGRFARLERRWDCRRGTPKCYWRQIMATLHYFQWTLFSVNIFTPHNLELSIRDIRG